VISIVLALAAGLAAVLGRWRDLSSVVLLGGATVLLWQLPWGVDLLGWAVAVAALGWHATRSPVRGELILGAVAIGGAVHLAAALASLTSLAPLTVRWGATSVVATCAVGVCALALARPARTPRVRWVGEVPIEGPG